MYRPTGAEWCGLWPNSRAFCPELRFFRPCCPKGLMNTDRVGARKKVLLLMYLLAVRGIKFPTQRALAHVCSP